MKVPLLKMEGRSGCKLEVFNMDGKFRIRKFSRDRNYDSRLLLQAQKQSDFFKRQSGKFSTPEVLQVVTSAEGSWFEMPYLHGYKYSEFFDRATILEIRQLSDQLINYLSGELDRAAWIQIKPELFLDKLNSVDKVLQDRKDLDRDLIEASGDRLSAIPDDPFPSGICHGDMTFSNMIFCDESICLVDFLDSFVDSPVIDFVKLRQDTAFYWSLHVDQELPLHRHAKIVQVFDYLDNRLSGWLLQRPEVLVWYNYLQLFNFVRILPYVSEPADINFVQRALTQLVH